MTKNIEGETTYSTAKEPKLTMQDIEEAIAKVNAVTPKSNYDTLTIVPEYHKKGLIERVLSRFGYIKGSTKAQMYKMDSSKFKYQFKKFNEL